MHVFTWENTAKERSQIKFNLGFNAQNSKMPVSVLLPGAGIDFTPPPYFFPSEGFIKSWLIILFTFYLTRQIFLVRPRQLPIVTIIVCLSQRRQPRTGRRVQACTTSGANVEPSQVDVVGCEDRIAMNHRYLPTCCYDLRFYALQTERHHCH